MLEERTETILQLKHSQNQKDLVYLLRKMLQETFLRKKKILWYVNLKKIHIYFGGN